MSTARATSLSDLIAQKESLDRQIREAQSQAKAGAIKMVRDLMSAHGLTAADLVASARTKQGTKPGTKLERKYRAPVGGSTWSGRGLKPMWLSAAIESGKTLQDFAI